MSAGAGLRNPVGLGLLALSGILVIIGMSGVVREWTPSVGLMLAFGVLGYLIIAVIATPAASAPVMEIVRIRNEVKHLYDEEVRKGPDASPTILDTIADAAREMDVRLIPAFRQIVVKHDSLTMNMRRFESGGLPAPDPTIRQRLNHIHNMQQQSIDFCLQQARNAQGTLLGIIALPGSDDLTNQTRMWAMDLQDISEAITAVLATPDSGESGGDIPSPEPKPEPEHEERLDSLVEPSQIPAKEPRRSVRTGTASEVPPLTPAAVFPFGLTLREAEVLTLIADGATSKEIAAGLVIDPSTVNRHIANIYRKIDARGRADATRIALRNSISRERVRQARDRQLGKQAGNGATPVDLMREVARRVAAGEALEQVAKALRLTLAATASHRESARERIKAELSQGRTLEQVAAELGTGTDGIWRVLY